MMNVVVLVVSFLAFIDYQVDLKLFYFRGWREDLCLARDKDNNFNHNL